MSQGTALFGPYISWTKIPSSTKILGATVCEVYLAPTKHLLFFYLLLIIFNTWNKVSAVILVIEWCFNWVFFKVFTRILWWDYGGFSEVFVLLLFFNFWRMCPFTVCYDLGRYFLTRSTVRPGKVTNKFCFISSIHVEIGGLKYAWWRKIARFFFGEHSYTEFTENCSRIRDGFIFFYVVSFSFIYNINSFVRVGFYLLS